MANSHRMAALDLRSPDKKTRQQSESRHHHEHVCSDDEGTVHGDSQILVRSSPRQSARQTNQKDSNSPPMISPTASPISDVSDEQHDSVGSSQNQRSEYGHDECDVRSVSRNAAEPAPDDDRDNNQNDGKNPENSDTYRSSGPSQSPSNLNGGKVTQVIDNIEITEKDKDTKTTVESQQRETTQTTCPNDVPDPSSSKRNLGSRHSTRFSPSYEAQDLSNSFSPVSPIHHEEDDSENDSKSNLGPGTMHRPQSPNKTKGKYSAATWYPEVETVQTENQKDAGSSHASSFNQKRKGDEMPRSPSSSRILGKDASQGDVDGKMTTAMREIQIHLHQHLMRRGLTWQEVAPLHESGVFLHTLKVVVDDFTKNRLSKTSDSSQTILDGHKINSEREGFMDTMGTVGNARNISREVGATFDDSISVRKDSNNVAVALKDETNPTMKDRKRRAGDATDVFGANDSITKQHNHSDPDSSQQSRGVHRDRQGVSQKGSSGVSSLCERYGASQKTLSAEHQRGSLTPDLFSVVGEGKGFGKLSLSCPSLRGEFSEDLHAKVKIEPQDESVEVTQTPGPRDTGDGESLSGRTNREVGEQKSPFLLTETNTRVVENCRDKIDALALSRASTEQSAYRENTEQRLFNASLSDIRGHADAQHEYYKRRHSLGQDMAGIPWALHPNEIGLHMQAAAEAAAREREVVKAVRPTYTPSVYSKPHEEKHQPSNHAFDMTRKASIQEAKSEEKTRFTQMERTRKGITTTAFPVKDDSSDFRQLLEDRRSGVQSRERERGAHLQTERQEGVEFDIKTAFNLQPASPDETENLVKKEIAGKYKTWNPSPEVALQGGSGKDAEELEVEENFRVTEDDCRNVCVTDGGVSVTLMRSSVWRAFNSVGTEMIVNRSGRRMFPFVTIQLSGLDPHGVYHVLLEVVPADNHRYKFINDAWEPVGVADTPAANLPYSHPDSPNSGDFWLCRQIHFSRVKLTNNRDSSEGNMLLHSMHKYAVIIHVQQSPDVYSHQVLRHFRFRLDMTSFIAVTAYQNDLVTKLKIHNNPFAKAFRDAGYAGGHRRTQQLRKRNCGNPVLEDTCDEGSPPKKRVDMSRVRNPAISLSTPTFYPPVVSPRMASFFPGSGTGTAPEAMPTMWVPGVPPPWFSGLGQGMLNPYLYGLHQHPLVPDGWNPGLTTVPSSSLSSSPPAPFTTFRPSSSSPLDSVKQEM